MQRKVKFLLWPSFQNFWNEVILSHLTLWKLGYLMVLKANLDLKGVRKYQNVLSNPPNFPPLLSIWFSENLHTLWISHENQKLCSLHFWEEHQTKISLFKTFETPEYFNSKAAHVDIITWLETRGEWLKISPWLNSWAALDLFAVLLFEDKVTSCPHFGWNVGVLNWSWLSSNLFDTLLFVVAILHSCNCHCGQKIGWPLKKLDKERLDEEWHTFLSAKIPKTGYFIQV